MFLQNLGITKFDNFDFMKTFFVIVLGISGNFLGETFSCQSKKLLNNMFVKDILLLVMLYFAIDLFDSDNNLHPLIRARDAFLIWVFYNMFTKMTILPTLIVFCLLCGLYVITDLIDYNKGLSRKDDAHILKLEKIKIMMGYGVFAVTSIGFFMYYMKQRKDHGRKFSNFLFFKGVEKCRHE